ncbi:hypothetical protein B0H67DRAFT_475871 [Lasiosphaeris hirsuta]|uniref:Uncharacterized protein n=1 Tax=Lasiosphaeris hirsuta TaxID=260670 RepID=A0AA40EBE3_9PEZI|nr:hypothetical protein B0H67DRAFT_475871 [Lasiosphaeris hirsuta]
MSSDNSNNVSSTSSNDMARSQRRGSVSSMPLASLFRSNSISQPQPMGFSGPLTTVALNDQRRRLSITTLGLSGTSPTAASASFLRRASLSTNSDSLDENAVEEDDVVRTVPTTPFARRMSLGGPQAMRSVRGGASPGSNGRRSPPMRRSSIVRGSPPTPPLGSAGAGNYTWSKIQASTTNQPRPGSDLCSPARSDQGFNWSDQLRSRAESTVSAGPRASFSFSSGLNASPPRSNPSAGPPPTVSPHHDRAKSVSDMPAPPAQQPRARAPQKPDHFQERILKGDFYMD